MNVLVVMTLWAMAAGPGSAPRLEVRPVNPPAFLDGRPVLLEARVVGAEGHDYRAVRCTGAFPLAGRVVQTADTGIARRDFVPLEHSAAIDGLPFEPGVARGQTVTCEADDFAAGDAASLPLRWTGTVEVGAPLEASTLSKRLGFRQSARSVRRAVQLLLLADGEPAHAGLLHEALDRVVPHHAIRLATAQIHRVGEDVEPERDEGPQVSTEVQTDAGAIGEPAGLDRVPPGAKEAMVRAGRHRPWGVIACLAGRPQPGWLGGRLTGIGGQHDGRRAWSRRRLGSGTRRRW